MVTQSTVFTSLVLVSSLLITSPLLAQFRGGEGDGYTDGRIVQVTFDGVPVGVAGLFLGGVGDGSDQAVETFTLSGNDLSFLFQGGGGDGFDFTQASITIDGQNLSLLFRGGDGDGFDRSVISITVAGETLAGLFAGGDGDGFAEEKTSLTISGVSLAGLFGGGDGDGFDHHTVTLLVDGTMLAGLFGGGDGDGFDIDRLSSVVNGESLAGLFGGGDGDGFDVSRYEGSIPLPLTLISFDAFPEQDYVLLKWVTEDEQATDYFTIEKTVDGRAFAEVGDLAAAGFSEPGERLHYEMRDEAPYQGTSFYRLRTTDFDGVISLSHLVEVEYSNAVDWSFSLFPNPNTGRHFSVTTTGMEAGEMMTIQVFDLTGKALFAESYRNFPGESFRFDLARRLPAGSYMIRLGHASLGYQAKLLLVGN